MIAQAQAVLLVICPALLIVAALKDVTTYTIPNWITLALIAAFFPTALILGLGLDTVGLHAAIGFCALVAGMVMFALRWIGGGDAKVFAATALWLGWPASATFLLATAMAGGVLAVMLLAMRSIRLRPYVSAGPPWLSRLAEPGESVPYGLAICIGGLAAFPASTLVQALGA
ncbi:prepilin peptidase [Phenylobacterium sp.]|uniref:A24 family peptidase n=1 Tax=Phenylobacterium sp. TaxID=1871053 RepID=UPI002730CA98|nr:prepilin peptidase [Phenylobacterium sp.]MDP1617147.1 prepilin peptidase [Phenylobacterium sp.]MDP1989037.1 prepilin peptidase [Phenylobacterium sp.]